jgi:hypothetical protein
MGQATMAAAICDLIMFERRGVEDEVAFECRVEPDLAVVESKVVLADLEVLLHRPTHAGDGDEGE